MMRTMFVKSTVRPAVGEAALVEELQQHIEHVGVGLLDLVEEEHAYGAAHRFVSWPPSVTHVAGRRAHMT